MAVSAASELVVLFEDAWLIAVDKPAGLHTAPLGRVEEDTLLGRVIARFPEVGTLPGLKPTEPGLLHRLDRETSGVVIVARAPEAFRRLRADFDEGRARKEYLALCSPARAARQGERFRLESRFAPHGPGRKRVRVILPAEEGKKAARQASPDSYHTEARIVEVRGNLALVRAVIVKGFRHQVRAHLAHLGLPIAGDPLYGVPAPAGVPERLYLHASAVELAHPDGGRRLRIEAPLPPAFALCYGCSRGHG
jgi:23S rRNA pseudouridine1911/1915/1917 synthase